MRRPLSSKAQSKPKPAKSGKVPEYPNKFRLLLHDLELFVRDAWRKVANRHSMRSRSNASGAPMRRHAALWLSGPQHSGTFMDYIFLWWVGKARLRARQQRAAGSGHIRNMPYPQYTVVSNMIHRPELSWSYRKTSGEVACAKSAVSQRLSC